MLKVAALALVVVVVAFVGFAATRPATYRIERTAVVPGKPATVSALLDNYDQFSTWSPWQKLDPAMTAVKEGPARGVGATFRWSGNDKAGAGSMVITGVKPGEQVLQDVRFERPFPSVSRQAFALAADPAGTRVTWSMEGDNSLFAKAMQVFVSMDDLLGKDLAEGLANLGPVVAAAEARSASAPAAAALSGR